MSFHCLTNHTASPCETETSMTPTYRHPDGMKSKPLSVTHTHLDITRKQPGRDLARLHSETESSLEFPSVSPLF